MTTDLIGPAGDCACAEHSPRTAADAAVLHLGVEPSFALQNPTDKVQMATAVGAVFDGAIPTMAMAAALQTVTRLVVLKNVPLNLDKRAVVAQEALDWLTSAEMEQVSMLEREGAAALTQCVNRLLDMHMIAWTLEHICARGGMDIHDPGVPDLIREIVTIVEADAIDETCLHWPDIGDLADRFNADLLREVSDG